MAEGSVRWFNDERGFGVIQQDGGPELRVQYLDIQRNGYKTLEAGERVSFDVRRDVHGLHAVTVTPLGTSAPPPPAPPPRPTPTPVAGWRRALGHALMALCIASFVAFFVSIFMSIEWGALFLPSAFALGYLSVTLTGD
ncbi:cold-shock protein [Actinomadura madurae]|uniref:cold-shock protein n=1 Tax=Actinomadura madurae TaxID=1993 RepID=UPI000D9FDD73|nr:cold-shock protein [Actinomadura madurae]SPT59654.1 Cold shock protein CspC [Actinomadura madurae]